MSIKSITYPNVPPRVATTNNSKGHDKTSKAVAAHRSGMGNIEVTVLVAADGACEDGVEVESPMVLEPDVLTSLLPDVAVPGRLLTGSE